MGWKQNSQPLDMGEAKSTVYVWIGKSLQNSIKRKKVIGWNLQCIPHKGRGSTQKDTEDTVA